MTTFDALNRPTAIQELGRAALASNAYDYLSHKVRYGAEADTATLVFGYKRGGAAEFVAQADA